jgi:hypothetical protein
MTAAAPRAVNDAQRERRARAAALTDDQVADAVLAELVHNDAWRAKFEADFESAFGPAAEK